MNAMPEIARTAGLGPNILCPTDFGPGGAGALAHAVALSLAARARLSLLHIRGVDDAGPTPHGLGPVVDLLVRWGRLGEHERFADLSARLRFSATCLDVPARRVSEGVLDHFAAHPVELAVLTTHARSGLGYWFAGSTGRRALRQADAKILFLREGARGFVDPRSGEIRLKRALVALDGRIPAAAPLARVRRLIGHVGAAVETRLLHVGDAPPGDCPKDLPLTLARGPVAATILRAAQDFGADLIVMPTAGRRGVLAAFRNSVSAAVIEDARWPVLSAPAPS